MLPRKNRLPLKTEFPRLQKEGKLFPGRLFSLIVASGNFPRFAFIVSQKIDKRSTYRNRARRILEEATFHLLPKLRKNFTAVILAKKKILEANFAQVSWELTALFKRANLLKENEKNRPLVN